MFHPTLFDIGDFLFTFGLFFTSFLLFAKFLPVVNMAEVKAILNESSEKLPYPFRVWTKNKQALIPETLRKRNVLRTILT